MVEFMVVTDLMEQHHRQRWTSGMERTRMGMELTDLEVVDRPPQQISMRVVLTPRLWGVSWGRRRGLLGPWHRQMWEGHSSWPPGHRLGGRYWWWSLRDCWLRPTWSLRTSDGSVMVQCMAWTLPQLIGHRLGITACRPFDGRLQPTGAIWRDRQNPTSGQSWGFPRPTTRRQSSTMMLMRILLAFSLSMWMTSFVLDPATWRRPLWAGFEMSGRAQRWSGSTEPSGWSSVGCSSGGRETLCSWVSLTLPASFLNDMVRFLVAKFHFRRSTWSRMQRIALTLRMSASASSCWENSSGWVVELDLTLPSLYRRWAVGWQSAPKRFRSWDATCWATCRRPGSLSWSTRAVWQIRGSQQMSWWSSPSYRMLHMPHRDFVVAKVYWRCGVALWSNGRAKGSLLLLWAVQRPNSLDMWMRWRWANRFRSSWTSWSTTRWSMMASLRSEATTCLGSNCCWRLMVLGAQATWGWGASSCESDWLLASGMWNTFLEQSWRPICWRSLWCCRPAGSRSVGP